MENSSAIFPDNINVENIICWNSPLREIHSGYGLSEKLEYIIISFLENMSLIERHSHWNFPANIYNEKIIVEISEHWKMFKLILVCEKNMREKHGHKFQNPL